MEASETSAKSTIGMDGGMIGPMQLDAAVTAAQMVISAKLTPETADSTTGSAVESRSEAQRAFNTSIIVSGIRCTLAYVVLPFIAPLIGLAPGIGPLIGIPIAIVAIIALNAIMGLIQAFTAVANANPAEKADLLSASISVAMNTTAFGLMVAIPLLVVHAILTSKTGDIVDSLEMATVKALNVFSRRAKRAVEA